jgi:hypothetical protein
MTSRSDSRTTNVPLRWRPRFTHTECVARVLVIVVLLLALSAGTAAARDGDRGGGDSDVRVAGVCGRGATANLRVRTRDNGIEVRFALRQTRGRGLWRVTIVHENRVAVRTTAKTTSGDDSYEVRRMLRDLPGSDTVVVHAWGPSGLGCRAAATLPDSSS